MNWNRLIKTLFEMNWNNLFQLEKVIWNRNKFEVNFSNFLKLKNEFMLYRYSKYKVSEIKQWFTTQNKK